MLLPFCLRLHFNHPSSPPFSSLTSLHVTPARPISPQPVLTHRPTYAAHIQRRILPIRKDWNDCIWSRARRHIKSLLWRDVELCFVWQVRHGGCQVTGLGRYGWLCICALVNEACCLLFVTNPTCWMSLPPFTGFIGKIHCLWTPNTDGRYQACSAPCQATGPLRNHRPMTIDFSSSNHCVHQNQGN